MPGRVVARPWLTWLIGLVALAGVLYSALGYGMAASLGPSDPVPGQRSVAAYAYLIAFAVSLLVLVATVIALIRRRRHDHSNDASAAA